VLTGAALIPDRLSAIVIAPPYAVDEMLAYLGDVRDGVFEGIRLDTPAILDFRAVRLTDLRSEEIHRYVGRRRKLTSQPSFGPVAFLCGDAGSFGMLRMYSILAELNGLRRESATLISTDAEEAFGWIAARAGLDNAERALAAGSLEGLAGWQGGLGAG